MTKISMLTAAVGCFAALGACSTNDASQVAPASSTPAPAQTTPSQPTPAGVSGGTARPGTSTPVTSAPAPAAPAKAGSPAAGPVTATAGVAAAGSGSAGVTAAAGAKATEGGVPATPALMELPTEITNVDVTKNTMRRFGAPHVAINAKDPNNIIVLASSNLGYTKACLPAAPGSDCEMVAAGGMFLLQQPRGFAKTDGFMDIGVYVSKDRGKTFKYVDVKNMVPPGHPEVRSRGEGPIAAMPDGSFFIGFNAVNWGNWETQPETFFPNGGVGVIKSTDGGDTWSWVSYSNTPADWPYGGSDPIMGTFYVTSGLVGLSTLGPRSTGLPDSKEGSLADRWIASTQDGVKWTEPKTLGAESGGQHVGAGHSPVAAAHGIMATLFLASDASSCRVFTNESASGCVVFQTSTDAGASWSRHRVPTPTGFSPAALSVFVGADPTQKEHFTVALLSDSGNDFVVLATPDSGKTWSAPVRVGEDASKTHFAPFVGYAPTGEFGLMWRTYEPDPSKPGASPPTMPYSVWAALSKDGGKTFSKPLKVSKANSPSCPSDPNDNFAFVGDHGPSGIALDGHGGVFVVWADWTPGERAIFMATVRTEAFSF